ncbi:MAG: hypothetical protein IJW70_02570 [Clostridia bacterium]|nr:hypothetical protein [Clostridia bacterium]
MKALSIISFILAVLGLVMTIAGFFMDSYLGPVGSYIWRTAELLLLTGYLVIFPIVLYKAKKDSQKETDKDHDQGDGQ